MSSPSPKTTSSIFEALRAELIADLAPKTVMERKLASAIATGTHLAVSTISAPSKSTLYALGTEDPDNIVNCEVAQIHTAMSDAITFGKESAKLALMSVYEQRMNRSLHKNLDKLRELQAERKLNHQRDLIDETSIALANDLNGLPYNAPLRPGRNGSVFSTSEILAAANRQTILNTARAKTARCPSRQGPIRRCLGQPRSQSPNLRSESSRCSLKCLVFSYRRTSA